MNNVYTILTNKGFTLVNTHYVLSIPNTRTYIHIPNGYDLLSVVNYLGFQTFCKSSYSKYERLYIAYINKELIKLIN